MTYLNILLQGNYESWGLKSILIATVIALGGVIAYLYKSKETALEKKDIAHQKAIDFKDNRIREVIKDHQNDLKESNNDMKTFVEKYHQFTEHIKDVVNARHQ